MSVDIPTGSLSPTEMLREFGVRFDRAWAGGREHPGHGWPGHDVLAARSPKCAGGKSSPSGDGKPESSASGNVHGKGRSGSGSASSIFGSGE